MKRIISLIILGLVVCISFAQDISNKGKEFWVGYGLHQYMEPSCDGSTQAQNDMNMVLYFSSDQQTTVTVTIDSALYLGQGWTRTYNIPANTMLVTENLPKGLVNAAASGSDPNFDARLFDNSPPLGTGGENLWRKKGIHIVSNVPITAVAHIFGGVASSATLLMPVNTWGYSYTSVNSEQRDADRSYSWIYVIAKEDNTLVEITPAATSRLGKPVGVPFQVVMQKGQIYQLVGQADCSTGNGPELTGTMVKSLIGADGTCHPIAVFGGSSRTGGETLTCGTGSGRDNDIKQLPPENAWGKRYGTAPFSKSSGSMLHPSAFQTSVYKVIVKDPTTVVRKNGIVLTGLINNRYYKFASNTADFIVANKPIMVTQFMSGTGACNGGYGDPEMITLTPLEQAVSQVRIPRIVKEAIQTNYLTLVVPTVAIPSLLIDNSAVFNHVYPHPNLPGYTVVVKGWASAQTQTSVTCDSAFTGITYGLGGAESYGFNVGANYKDQSQSIIIKNPFATVNFPATCILTPLNMEVALPYQATKLVWDFHGQFANVTNNNPIPDSSYVADDGRTLYLYRLNTNYIFIATGNYPVTVLATNPFPEFCNGVNTLESDIQVFDSPLANFNVLYAGCASDSVRFLDTSNGAGRAIIKRQWNFGDGTSDTVLNPTKLYTSGGQYLSRLNIVTDVGCVSDVAKMVQIAPLPIVKFGVQLPTCTRFQVTFSDSSTVASDSLVKWYWDYGNGQRDTVTTNVPRIITYAAAGTYIVKLVVETNSGCKKSVQATITIPNEVPSCGVNICPGNTTYFRSGNAASGNTWQWQVDTGSGFINISDNSIYSGTTADTLKLTTPPTSWYGYRFRCLLNGSPFSPEFVLKFTVIWTGNTSTAWENTTNWSCGILPDDYTDVLMNPGLSNYPLVNADASCGSLKLMPGTNVRVMPGVKLEIKREQ